MIKKIKILEAAGVLLTALFLILIKVRQELTRRGNSPLPTLWNMPSVVMPLRKWTRYWAGQ